MLVCTYTHTVCTCPALNTYTCINMISPYIMCIWARMTRGMANDRRFRRQYVNEPNRCFPTHLAMVGFISFSSATEHAQYILYLSSSQPLVFTASCRFPSFIFDISFIDIGQWRGQSWNSSHVDILFPWGAGGQVEFLRSYPRGGKSRHAFV
jgi:hypothetical protein